VLLFEWSKVRLLLVQGMGLGPGECLRTRPGRS
jgi:hypothetical protein